MDVQRRAKQFAPFAALRGLDETVRKEEIVYEQKKELSEEQSRELDQRLRRLQCGMNVCVTYFAESKVFPGKGQYHTLSGVVRFFNPSLYLRVEEEEVPISSISNLSGEVFADLDTPC